MHVAEITDRIGREFVKEAEVFPGDWGPDLIPGVIDQRIKYGKLFMKDGKPAIAVVGRTIRDPRLRWRGSGQEHARGER